MTFADLAAGEHVFVDSTSLIYHFSPHPTFGPACHQLMATVENQVIQGYTSTHMIGELAHALMIVEALSLPGWQLANVPKRLGKQPATVWNLKLFEHSVQTIFQSRCRILSIPPDLMLKATAISRQFGLLTNDAIIIAVMESHGLTNLASSDPDFDRVPGITRYSPFLTPMQTGPRYYENTIVPGAQTSRPVEAQGRGGTRLSLGCREAPKRRNHG